MSADVPSTFDDFKAGLWPPADRPPEIPIGRDFMGAVARKIGPLPESWTSYVNQLVVAKADGTGPTAASVSGGTALTTGGKPIIAPALPISATTTSFALKGAQHNSATIICANASAQTVVLALDSSGVNGIWDGFTCVIFRDGPGTVSLSLGSGISPLIAYPAGIELGYSIFMVYSGGKLRLGGHLV